MACFVCRAHKLKKGSKNQLKTNLFCRQCRLAFHLPYFNYLHRRTQVPSIIPEESKEAVGLAVKMYHGAMGNTKSRLRRTAVLKIGYRKQVPSVADDEESDE